MFEIIILFCFLFCFENAAYKIPQFVHEHLSHWTSILHGVSKIYPNFEIITKVESSALSFNQSNHKWWCALFIKESANKTLMIKSNLISI